MAMLPLAVLNAARIMVKMREKSVQLNLDVQIANSTTESQLSANGNLLTTNILHEIEIVLVGSKLSTEQGNRMLIMESRNSSSTLILQQNLGRKQQAQDQLFSYLINNCIPAAAVQEPYTINDIMPSNAPYTVISCDAGSGRPRAAILVSSQIQAISLSQFISQDICACTLSIGGTLLTIVSVYIPPHRLADGTVVPIEPFLGTIETLLQGLQGKVLVCGDFNSHHTVWGSSRSDQRGSKVSDFVAASDLHILNNGTMSTFYTVRDGVEFQSYIDLSLATVDLLQLVQNWQVRDGITTADHRTILIQLELSPSNIDQSHSTRRFNTRLANWDQFAHLVSNRATGWRLRINQIESYCDVDYVTTHIFSDLVNVCEQTFRPPKPRKYTVPWWTPGLTLLMRNAKRWKKRYWRVTTPALKRTYLPLMKQAQKEFDQAVRWAKRDSWREFVSGQERETVWSQVYRVCRNHRKQPPTTIRLPNGDYTQDAFSTAAFLLNRFLPDDDPEADSQYHQSLRELAICRCSESVSSGDDVPFSNEEVADAVSRQNGRKSPGEDGLSADIFKAAYGQANDVFDRLFNCCLEYGCFPTWFKSSIVKAIPKPSAIDLQQPKSWRPISLLSVPGKVLERLIIQRVMFDLRTRNLLSPHQYGFTPKRSTIDAIDRVVCRMRSVRDSGRIGAIISLDVSAAFDGAWWTAIMMRLKKLRIPHNLWHICRDYFKDRVAKLNVAGTVVSKVVTRGCPQGSACGPGFWNILYDEVLQLEMPNNCELTSFADDLVLQSWASSMPALESQVNTAVCLITEWGRNVKLKFNSDKTQAMVYSRKRNIPAANLVMDGNRLQTVDHLRYLGVILDKDLKWKHHLIHTQQKASRVISQIMSVARNTWGLSSPVTELVYKGAIEPMVLYGAEIWEPCLRSNWAKRILSQIQRACLLRVCKSYRTVSYEACCIIANVMPFKEKVDELTSLRQVKLTGMMQGNGIQLPIQQGALNGRHPALTTLGFVNFGPSNDSMNYSIYTDGSKSDEGVGSAFVVYQQSTEIHHRIFRLPVYCSVFQAELLALKKALEHLLDSRPMMPVQIFSDSLSSLMAIQDRNSDTQLVSQIQELLMQLRYLAMSVTIYWVKAHVGVAGNERADQLAKSSRSYEAEPIELCAPLSFAKRNLRVALRIKWNDDWRTSQNGSWTRQIFDTVENRRKVGDIPLNFVLTQFLSGHGKFGSYLHRFTLRDNPHCECGALQDPEHLMFDCHLVNDLRTDILAECTMRGIRFNVLTIGRLLSDLSTSDILITFLQSVHRRLVLWED